MAGPGTLYVVATPIGHLDDITLRALRTFREVSVVAAEDTRRTGNLLRHYDIATPLVSLHEHNEHSRAPELVRRMLAGDSVALASDAGTPGISDPGAVLVAKARAAGIRVEPIPGPSAVMAALSVAGLPLSSFSFLGFPPTRSKDRKFWFAALTDAAGSTVVFFEAPHRIVSTITEISNYVKRPIIIARELTKKHEEVLTGLPETLAAQLTDPMGEFTVVIPPEPPTSSDAPTFDQARLDLEIGLITKTTQTQSKRQTARLVAERLGLPTRVVYEALCSRDKETAD